MMIKESPRRSPTHGVASGVWQPPWAAATRIEVAGSTDGLDNCDGNPHPQTQVSIFCIPPTFDNVVDAAGDLPGPGAVLLIGDAKVQ